MDLIPHASVAALVSQGRLEREAQNAIGQLSRAVMIQAKSGRETAHISLLGVGEVCQKFLVDTCAEQGYQVEKKPIAGIQHLFLLWGNAKGKVVVKGDDEVEAEAKARAKAQPPEPAVKPEPEKVVEGGKIITKEEQKALQAKKREARQAAMAKARAGKAAKAQEAAVDAPKNGEAA